MKLEDPLLRIPLVLAFTPDYLIPASVCLSSILVSSPDVEFDVVVLLSEDIPVRMQEELTKLEPNRFHFTFINLHGKLSDIYVNEKYTIAASYRLLLPELLPQYDRVIYIDCDMVVRNDIAELYRNIVLGDNYLAGVFEATLSFQLPHMTAIGCEPGSYINSGFLIMNLVLLRRDKMLPRFLKAAQAPDLEFPDQDVLNQLCKDRILGLEPKYNGIRTFFLPQYKSDFLKYYTEEQWESVQLTGTVHYTGAKPWDAFTVKFQLWWDYYKMLPQPITDFGQIKAMPKILYAISRSKFGKKVLETLPDLYRKMKYKL